MSRYRKTNIYIMDFQEDYFFYTEPPDFSKTKLTKNHYEFMNYRYVIFLKVKSLIFCIIVLLWLG